MEKDTKVTFDFAKFVSGNIADQIKQADTKAVGTLSILGIVTGALLARLNSIKGASGITDVKWLAIFVFSLIMVALAMKSIIRVVYPRMGKATKQSLTYFHDIVAHGKDEYVAKGMEQSAEHIAQQTFMNAYNLAFIAEKKYIALKHAMFLTGSVIIWTIFVLLFV